MAYTGTVVERAAGVSGCLQSFTETTADGDVLRSNMQSGQTVKARRVSTRVIQTAQATAVVPVKDVFLWRDWYQNRCKSGTLPTRFIMPWGAEEIWRFASKLQYEWIRGAKGAVAVRITFNMEQLPLWAD